MPSSLKNIVYSLNCRVGYEVSIGKFYLIYVYPILKIDYKILVCDIYEIKFMCLCRWTVNTCWICLFCLKHCYLFKPFNNPVKAVLLFPFYKWGDWELN